MRATWITKHGLRRVRHDPPTLEEAIFAAKGLTNDLEQQVEIAASLMGLPQEEVRAAIMKAEAAERAAQRRSINTVTLTGRGGAPRAVIVERRTTRRPAGRLR